MLSKDTTAAVVGALVGLWYGSKQIPVVWELKTARRNQTKQFDTVCMGVKQGNNQIGVTEDRYDAVRIATTQAQKSGSSVAVLAYPADGQHKEVIFKPDGTNEKIWYIDRGDQVQLQPGVIYLNRGGGKYRCIRTSDGKVYMVNTKSHWCFKAVNVVQYIDGTIE